MHAAFHALPVYPVWKFLMLFSEALKKITIARPLKTNTTNTIK